MPIIKIKKSLDSYIPYIWPHLAWWGLTVVWNKVPTSTTRSVQKIWLTLTKWLTKPDPHFKNPIQLVKNQTSPYNNKKVKPVFSFRQNSRSVPILRLIMFLKSLSESFFLQLAFLKSIPEVTTARISLHKRDSRAYRKSASRKPDSRFW